MAVTNHSALYRFSFPDAAPETLSPVVLVDMIDHRNSRQKAPIIYPSPGCWKLWECNHRRLLSIIVHRILAYYCRPSPADALQTASHFPPGFWAPYRTSL
ncbi:uncharacterized protein BDW43DRAFT_66939 [Aspergillus alliaceus]|uniref:uncharacterized protein n=1 Tax=Petromyces alliaceus TaxID=209559 RepID=UPI0012A6599C|nr:uncharacterized protein BDW43DRAFT_66939 [Aspergillus alliaceus]KAB8234046.1 hypothetical protein BDW43DRAFT_66939 [Aspergillus alliaceus]